MKLKLNKKNLKALSQNKKMLPANMTPQIAGGMIDAGVSFRPSCANYGQCEKEV